MARNITKRFRATGTTCESCAEIVREQALSIEGVKNASFDLSTENGEVSFDPDKTDLKDIFSAIEEKGYSCSLLEVGEEEPAGEKVIVLRAPRWLGWLFLALGLAIGIYFITGIVDTITFPQLTLGMSYGLLFLVGLLTGFHCIAMCGGFVVSYTLRDAQTGRTSHKSHLAYGAGKTVSYTIIGAGFGLLGSIIAFTPVMRGVAGLLAGLFLVLFGLRMLNIFPILRKIQLRTPKFVTRFVGEEQRKHSSPLVIGLLNGLMIACGPLQAIYIMAAGTGSLVEGAKLLFFFGIGTLPPLLGFGYVTSLISSKFTHKILKTSGAIVIVLGLVMINNGLVLTGSGYDVGSLTHRGLTGSAVENIPVLSGGFQEIRMEVNRYGWDPDVFVLKKDVPVKWIIDGEEINGCNNAIQVPKYGLEFDVRSGEQIIEFTPSEEGVIRWSCWMGMIPGTFIVKSDIDLTDSKIVQEEIDSIPQQPRGSCGGSCGSATCGAASGGSCGCSG